MNIEEFRDYCLAKPGTSESFPFDNNTLVFKVMGKMFTACDVDEFISFNAKCDPEKAIAYREKYHGINPGYHMNKRHWNTIETDGSVPDDVMRYLINHSYELVVSKLPKKDREALKKINQGS
jgi:predicted DNA-binding protein (MmcQ/YjbR family)